MTLQYGGFYHIYNRGINSCNIFYQKENYEHFLRLYAEYLQPVADTFAWVLMPNHFHFLIQIKQEHEIEYIKAKENKKHIVYAEKKKYIPENQVGHLCDAYAKAFNKRFNRTGSLFEKPFRRILVDNERYMTNLIHYIHNNPVKHRFVDSWIDYPWSSYLTLVSVKPTKLHRDRVLGWFNSRSEFVSIHKTVPDEELIKNYIIE